MKKLSDRAKVILAVIRERCAPYVDEKNPGHFFVPSAYPVYSEMFPAESIQINGAGDAAIIKSLIARGYAKPKNLCAYACEITEDGILAYEALRNDPYTLANQDRKAAEQSRLRAERDDET